jgi:hypothetical protein
MKFAAAVATGLSNVAAVVGTSFFLASCWLGYKNKPNRTLV